LRDEVAEAKRANTDRADTHDYSEAEARDYFIDLLLKEAGWGLDQARDLEFEVSGMRTARIPRLFLVSSPVDASIHARLSRSLSAPGLLAIMFPAAPWDTFDFFYE
jgi:hypothetical protein